MKRLDFLFALGVVWFGPVIGPAEANPVDEVTVLTYNIRQDGCPGPGPRCVRHGDLAQWDEEAKAIAATIRSSGADIVSLQEVNNDRRLAHGSVSVGAIALPVLETRFERIVNELHDVYPHTLYAPEAALPFSFGNAILSKFPLDPQASLCLFRGSTRKSTLPGAGPKPGYGDVLEPGCRRNGVGAGSRNAVVADFILGGRKVRFVAPHFGIYWNSCTGHKRDENAGCSALQVNHSLVEQSGVPAILAGDLNVFCHAPEMLETSESIGLGVNNLQNLSVWWDFFPTTAMCADHATQVKKAVCEGAPATDRYQPSDQYMIDYVLGSRSDDGPDWELVDRFVLGETPGAEASDHYGLVTRLRLRPGPATRTDSRVRERAVMLRECSKREVEGLAFECQQRGLVLHSDGDRCALP